MEKVKLSAIALEGIGRQFIFIIFMLKLFIYVYFYSYTCLQFTAGTAILIVRGYKCLTFIQISTFL